MHGKKFPADEPFLCDDELNMDTLESDDRDPTSMRERIGFQIAADMGLPMSYQRYILVFLNGIQHPYAYADTHHVERDYFRTWFPDADEVVVDWPHRWLETQQVDPRTVIAVLTHDPKFDVPALTVALRTNAGYVGAMGSRRTHEDRLVRLKEAGLTDEELSRLHSPMRRVSTG